LSGDAFHWILFISFTRFIPPSFSFSRHSSPLDYHPPSSWMPSQTTYRHSLQTIHSSDG
jgi:hypothetical protein